MFITDFMNLFSTEQNYINLHYQAELWVWPDKQSEALIWTNFHHVYSEAVGLDIGPMTRGTYVSTAASD
jgi:hypothetical protein